MCITLSESWTMADPRDLHRFVGYARVAEEAGMAGVMVGEHVAMGPNSCFNGPPLNPRDWISAGNQPSRYPHPSNLPILSAMAAVTSNLQLIAAAVLSVLRPPLVMAKEFATVDLISRGRLVIVPTVSWQREEYEAMGIDFGQRGKMLDEQLEIWQQLWNEGSPVSYDGRFYNFSEMYVEPAPYRDGGPQLWVGGNAFSPWLLRRTVRYGAGFFSFVPPTEEQLAELGEAMKAAGRDVSELEMAALLPTPAFTDATGLLDLDAAIANAPDMIAKGFSTLFIKPAQYIDDGDQLGDFCRTALRKLKAALAA
jgi:alkanesulfonate monooxygenase SsuD/methylene tetrahydromethanopterin reductase-like flavin-dependent oxidoreductase (luciferase family)